MDSSPEKRNSLLLIILAGVSLCLWCYLFRNFINGSTPLQGDAYAYLGHIRFYIDNISRGVYPLWDPFENHGNMNDYFLRRIGEFNPFFWIIVLYTKLGMPFVLAYRLFLISYFFLGIAGFYLLSQRLFKDHLISFVAALLLLFSYIGASIFESYLLLEIVPFIWFFYFLIAFIQTPQKAFFLGAIFSLMLINITYLPFYFYTILFVFLISYFSVFPSSIGHMTQQVGKFIGRHRIFSVLCIALLMISFIPGIFWYTQSCHTESLTMLRHTGSNNANPATLSIAKINEGGIIPHIIIDRQFINTDLIGLHDFYVPLSAFLILLACIWGRLNQRMTVLFIFGFIFILIGLTDACYIHQYLYMFLPFFKYIRNLQFFLQYAVLPAFILFTAELMQIFITDCKGQLIDRKWMTLWVTMTHAFVLGFIFFNHIGHLGYLPYIVIILSGGWMLSCVWSLCSSRVLILLLWAAIIIHPFDVYSQIAIDYLPEYQEGYDLRYDLSLPSPQQLKYIMIPKKSSIKELSQTDLPYFATRWYYEAKSSINNAILSNYLSAPFILYDHVQLVNGKINYQRLQKNMDSLENLAFIHSMTLNEQKDFQVLKQVPSSSPKARILTSVDNDFRFLKFDANDVVVKTSFKKPGFLVRTQNYHSHWKIDIDGKPTALLRTNICLQGLFIPAGEHEIHWHFGTPLGYFGAYFLVILYPLVLGWLICLLLI